MNQPEGGGAMEEDEEERGGECLEVDAYCLVPNGQGGLLRKHKSAVVAHLNKCLGMGVKLSSERLVAVRGGARTEPLATNAEAEAAKGDVNRNVISLGCHVVVQAESDDDKNDTRYYIACVVQMAKRWPGGARNASTP
jgi:hypothetical protein